jgi:hypothetical protein
MPRQATTPRTRKPSYEHRLGPRQEAPPVTSDRPFTHRWLGRTDRIPADLPSLADLLERRLALFLENREEFLSEMWPSDEARADYDDDRRWFAFVAINDAHAWLDHNRVAGAPAWSGRGAEDLGELERQLRRLASWVRDLCPMSGQPCARGPIGSGRPATPRIVGHASVHLSAGDMEGETPPDAWRGLSLIPGGLEYCFITRKLSGKAWQVLEALLASRCKRLTCAYLLRTVWQDAETQENTVTVTVAQIRKTLREVLTLAGRLPPDRFDPLPCVDKAPNLGWGLDLPEI